MIEKKLAPTANKTKEKGGLSMGPKVTSGWESKGYSAPTKETVLLVGESIGMPMATSRGFVPQTFGVGHMKLEAPPWYSGKRQPGAPFKSLDGC